MLALCRACVWSRRACNIAKSSTRGVSGGPWNRAFEQSLLVRGDVADNSLVNPWTQSRMETSVLHGLSHWSQVVTSGLRASDLQKMSMAHTSSTILRQERVLWVGRKRQTDFTCTDLEDLASPERWDTSDVLDMVPVHSGLGWSSLVPFRTGDRFLNASPALPHGADEDADLDLRSSSV